MCPAPNGIWRGTQSIHERNVRLGKVFPKAEQRLVGEPRGRVCEAVAEVQGGWVATLAEAQEGMYGDLPMLGFAGQDHKLVRLGEAAEQSLPALAQACREHYARLDHRGGAHSGLGILGKVRNQPLVAWLLQEDSHYGGAIEDQTPSGP